MRLSSPGIPVFVAIALLIAPLALVAQGESNVVLGGTKNAELSDGASALTTGDPERGVELTLIGLKQARGTIERRAALSNLCAGYLMLEQLDEALRYCNEAIEVDELNWRVYNNRALIYVMKGEFELAEADLSRCDDLNPYGRATKVVRQLLAHAKDPVAPVITMDDRRGAPNVDEHAEPPL